MKKLLMMMMLLVFAYGGAKAQEEMKVIYEKEVDHTFDNTANGSDDGYSYAASGKEISVFNNKTGELLWNKKFKEISDQLGKVDDIISMWNAKVIFVFDRKIGKDKMAAIDAETGALLWVSAKYQNVEDSDNIIYISDLGAFAITAKDNLTMVKVRTGEEMWSTTKFKGIVGDFLAMKDGSIVMINMKATLMGSTFAGMKNQIMRLNSKNGDIIWEQTYRGVAERKVLTKELLVKMVVEDDKLFLYMNGIQVFNYADGKPLWSAVFDETPSDVVKNKRPAGATKFGAYGVVAKPVVVGEYIYVLDLVNKRNQFLKKYALKTGKLIWTSAEIQNARAIPGLHVIGDKIILQVGGQVELQYETRVRTSNGVTYSRAIEMENIKPLNVQCFNASTGAQLWESEKLKKGMTNLFVAGDNAIVCSGKALYSMDINTGKEVYEKPLKEDNIGDAELILSYKGEVIILGEKGISSRKMSDGSYTASSKFKRSTPITYNGKYIYGDRAMALYTTSGDYAVYDLNTMKYKSFDARKDAAAYLTDDGMGLYVFESGGMIKKSKFTKLSAE